MSLEFIWSMFLSALCFENKNHVMQKNMAIKGHSKQRAKWPLKSVKKPSCGVLNNVMEIIMEMNSICSLFH